MEDLFKEISKKMGAEVVRKLKLKEEEAYDKGYNEAWDYWYEVGKQRGFGEGRRVGFKEAWKANTVTFNNGYNFGAVARYNEGYDDGVNNRPRKSYKEIEDESSDI